MKFNALKSAFLVSSMILGMSAGLSASADLSADQFWLGSTTLADNRDTDPIYINECGLQAVQFKVSINPVDIKRFAVRFDNGHVQEIDMRSDYARGDSSGWKDLRGNGTCVTEIIVKGDTDFQHGDRSRGQGRIDVYGRRFPR